MQTHFIFGQLEFFHGRRDVEFFDLGILMCCFRLRHFVFNDLLDDGHGGECELCDVGCAQRKRNPGEGVAKAKRVEEDSA